MDKHLDLSAQPASPDKDVRPVRIPERLEVTAGKSGIRLALEARAVGLPGTAVAVGFVERWVGVGGYPAAVGVLAGMVIYGFFTRNRRR